MARERELPNAEWHKKLTTEQYQVLRMKGTDPPFAGPLTDLEAPGVYRCAGCEEPVFSSKTKFHSGSGWPSFDAPVAPNAVDEIADQSHGMRRTEVVCAKCGGHLGHVFPDGPAETTGQRYCINSTALSFDPKP